MQGSFTEVNEKHKLVFSRPEQWLPKEGILYQYIENAFKGTPLQPTSMLSTENDLADLALSLGLALFAVQV